MTSGNGGVTFFTGVPLGGVTSGVVGCERSSASIVLDFFKVVETNTVCSLLLFVCVSRGC